MGNRHRQSRARIHPVAWLALGLVAAATVGLTASALIGTPRPDLAAVSAYTPEPVPTPTSMPIPVRVGVAEVMQRLDDAARPFNVAVLGDSTGISEKGWHVNLAVWMGTTYDRPTVIHPWDGRREVDAYQASTWGMTSGDNARIDMWNGSVGSTRSEHALTRLDRMIPVDPSTVDLIFVNYGHNHTPENMMTEGPQLVDTLASRYPNAAIVPILQNPERPGSPHAAMQESIDFYWEQWIKSQGYPYVDVRPAFNAQPDIDALLDTVGDLHPNAEGYRVWSDAVIAYLTRS